MTAILKQSTSKLDHSQKLGPTQKQKFQTRVMPFAIMMVVLSIIPLLDPSRTTYSLLNVMGINIVFALSYNMLLGQTGLLSFGHAVYFGMGGFASIHAMNFIEDSLNDGVAWAHYPVFALPILGFGAGALAGAVIGWPSCRRAGIPFAMISLGIAELIASAGFMFTSIFGGEEGVMGDRVNGIQLFGLSLGPISQVYIFIAFWTIVATVVMFAFTRTPLGRMAPAVRDNPERVEFVGYNPQRIRYLVFIMSAGFAGLAGGMAAVNYEIFTPQSLSLAPSGIVLLMAYIGGTRYFAGPILGAMLLTYMESNLSDYSEAWRLYLGLLFVAVVMFAPGGIAGLISNGFKGVFQTNGTFNLQPQLTRKLLKWISMSLAGFIVLLGAINLIELTVRMTNGFGEVFEPFGLHMSPNNWTAWAIGSGLFILGIASLKWISLRGEA